MTGAPRIIALGVVIHSPELSPFRKLTPAHSLTWSPGFLADPLESPAARRPMDAGVVAGRVGTLLQGAVAWRDAGRVIGTRRQTVVALGQRRAERPTVKARQATARPPRRQSC